MAALGPEAAQIRPRIYTPSLVVGVKTVLHGWDMVRSFDSAPADNASFTASMQKTVRPSSPWPGKIMALLRAGNPAAAIAQIKVAPSVRDLRALEKALTDAQLTGRWRDVDIAITENLQALSAPRLHRSP
jgi:hypothetical protein